MGDSPRCRPVTAGGEGASRELFELSLRWARDEGLMELWTHAEEVDAKVRAHTLWGMFQKPKAEVQCGRGRVTELELALMSQREGPVVSRRVLQSSSQRG